MSLYDGGGSHYCGLERLDIDRTSCLISMEIVRRFVWEHWKSRKRGYVSIRRAYPEGEWTTHLFIEPNADGRWRVDARWVPTLRDAANLEHYLLGDVVEIKWNRATADDKRYGLTPGTLYLRLSNITGDSLIL